MFSQGPQREEPGRSARPAAAEVARIQGGGLVQVIVGSLEPFRMWLFLNGRAVAQEDVESLLVNLEVPTRDDAPPVVTATLTQYVRSVSGERNPTTVELFPCTLEVVALGRRLLITCAEAGSLEGAVVSLGLLPNGSSRDVNGVQSLKLLLTDGVLDATLVWTDGVSEELLPQTVEPAWPRHVN